MTQPEKPEITFPVCNVLGAVRWAAAKILADYSDLSEQDRETIELVLDVTDWLLGVAGCEE